MSAPLVTTSDNFYLSASAISYIFNLRGNPDDLSISVYAGAKVVAYYKEYIGYDPALNYKQWTVSAFPTHFDDHVARYAHIALAADSSTALVVFPSTRLDLLGRPITDDGTDFLDTEGAPAPSEESITHYYIYLGKISSSGPDGRTLRKWEDGPIVGKLDTDQYRNDQATSALDKMFSISQLKEYIVQHLPFRSLFIGSSVQEQKEINDVQRSIDTLAPSDTIIPSTAFTDQEYLSKTKEEGQTVKSDVEFQSGVKVDGDAEVNDLKASGNVGSNDYEEGKKGWRTTVGGFAELASLRLREWLTVPRIKGNTEFEDDVKVNGSTRVNDLKASGNVGSEVFEPDLLGKGWNIGADGHGELDSLSIRKFLEVPELRYNRISVHTGVDWQTFGAGLIEEVKVLTDTTGIIKLKLEDGEAGAVAVDDLCMGIYHNETNASENATETTDDHHGNFQFAGFMTIYFRIVAMCDADGDTANPDSRNQYFRYEVRSASDNSWSKAQHPQPSMSFACYANPNNEERRHVIYGTTEYTLYVESSTQWEFGPENYYLIIGNLDGFQVYAINDAGKRYLKSLHGKGAMLGRVYMYEYEEHFTRLADRIDVTATPYVNADFSLGAGETMTLKAQMTGYDGADRTDATYTIRRASSDAASDTEWNARRGSDIANGTIALTIDDLLMTDGSHADAVQFTIIATRHLPSVQGGDVYSIERDVVVHNVGEYEMDIDLDDSLIALGETKNVSIKVISPRGADVTSDAIIWKVERESSNPAADQVWNALYYSDGRPTKAGIFAQQSKVDVAIIGLTWDSDATINDIDNDAPSTTFRFYASLAEVGEVQAILTI